ncbi:MAG: S41 family peptidase [Candidatus Omnitrophota bacterium]
MKKKSIAVLLTTCFVVGAIFAAQAKETTIIDNSKELFKQVQILADSITLISTDYVEPVKVKDLVYGAIRGMMNTLDGYSQFMDPESFKEITEETKGEFGGLGIEIGMRQGILTVIAPMEDTPAFNVGLLPDDKIVKIDGDITRDITLDEAVKKLRGTPGTGVSITVIREDVDKLLDFTITRAVIKLKSIKDARIIEDDIGYIKLIEFQERTAKDLASHIKELRKKGAKSLILDLRNNPGGLLDAAIEVADKFLKDGEMIVYTEGRSPKKRMEFRAKGEPEFGEIDIIVIVNKGSASAAEILAGALKDNKRALVIGVPTFGKGSVQTVIPLGDQSALRLTTAAYFTPSGKNLMDKGIEPDIYVEKMKVEPAAEEKGNDKQKNEIFKKVEPPEKTPKGSRSAGEVKKEDTKKESRKKEKEEKLPEYDNQVQAAVNVLKGVRIIEQRKTSVQPEKGE